MSDLAEDSSPIKPARLKVILEETGSTLAIRYQQRQWGPGCFLCLWLLGWTVGCIFLVREVITKPQIMTVVFAIPFWVSWIFVACLLLTMFVQREELLLDETGITFTKSIIYPIHRRSIPLNELKRFECSATTNIEVNESPIYYVELITLGKPLLAFSNLSDDERSWLAWRLNQQLLSLNLDAGNESARTHNRSAPTVAEPPSDNSWVLEDTYDGASFIQAGCLDLSAVGVLLFVTLFWNGIVSVFVAQLLGFGAPGPAQFSGGWWGLFVFLIPFEVVGALMLIALIFTVLEPVRRTNWRIDRNEIVHHQAWLRIGRRRRFDATSISQVQLDQTGGGTKWNLVAARFNTTTTASQMTRLRFVDDDNTEVVSIQDLTEGEARWMFDCLKREHPDWFR